MVKRRFVPIILGLLAAHSLFPEPSQDAITALLKACQTSPQAVLSFFRLCERCDVADAVSYAHLVALIAVSNKGQNERDAITMALGGPYQKAMVREVELLQKGYYVFYHGQMQQWGFQEDFTTALIAELAARGKAKKLRDDFLYIQNPQDILTNSPGRNPQSALWVNRFLLGSTRACGGSSSWYFAFHSGNNHSASRYWAPARDIFQAFGMGTLSSRYARRVTTLKNELSKVVPGGRLLQVAIPRSHLESLNMGWLTHSNQRGRGCYNQVAFANPVDPKVGYLLLDGCATSVPMSAQYLLNPNSGVKIYAYDRQASDLEAYTKWLNKREQLIKEIVDDMIDYELV